MDESDPVFRGLVVVHRRDRYCVALRCAGGGAKLKYPTHIFSIVNQTSKNTSTSSIFHIIGNNGIWNIHLQNLEVHAR